MKSGLFRVCLGNDEKRGEKRKACVVLWRGVLCERLGKLVRGFEGFRV